MLSFLIAAAIAASVPGTVRVNSAADFALIKGRVVIAQRSSQSVVIGVDENGDGFADQLFWFFAEQAPALNVRAETAVVEFRGDELVVIAGDTGNVLSFTVGKAHVTQQGIGTGSFAGYSGYGLNHVLGPSVSRIRMPAEAPHRAGRVSGLDDSGGTCSDETCIDYLNPVSPDYGGAGGSAATCDAGGPGANSCSVNSQSGDFCSVQCYAGFYACCTRNTMGPSVCHCVKN